RTAGVARARIRARACRASALDTEAWDTCRRAAALGSRSSACIDRVQTRNHARHRSSHERPGIRVAPYVLMKTMTKMFALGGAGLLAGAGAFAAIRAKRRAAAKQQDIDA